MCRMGVLLFLFGGCSLIIAINSANAMSKRGHWQAEKLSPVKQAEYLNTVEKEIILHLNMARTDPEQYAKKYIAPRTRYFAGNIYHDPENPYYKKGYRTREGILAVQECVNVMQNAQPASVLYPSKNVSYVAQTHALYLSSTGRIGHRGPDGSKPGTRIRRYGRWKITAENIAYGFKSASEIVASLLVDDGVRNRKHRSIILDPQFSTVGVAIKPHPIHRYVCVINFAGG